VNNLACNIDEEHKREAIKNLETEKLIQVTPHTGAIVAPVSSKELDEILELRMYLESLAAFLAVPHFTKQGILELKQNIAEQELLLLSGNLKEFGSLNIKFHQLIYRYNPNEKLNQMIYDLWDHSKRYRMVFDENVEFTRGSIEDHKTIVEAIESGDAERARLLMNNHRHRSTVEIKKRWRDTKTG
jgi:DNA-binding GntR family transcriptional regulator